MTIYQAISTAALEGYGLEGSSNQQLKIKLPTPKSEPNLRSSYIFPPQERKGPSSDKPSPEREKAQPVSKDK
jgi:hypothetical protein